MCTKSALHNDMTGDSKIPIILATLLPFLRLHHSCVFERKQNLPQCSPIFLLERAILLEEEWTKGALLHLAAVDMSGHPCEN